MSNFTIEKEPRICQPGGSGVLFPVADENSWPNEMRILLYAVGLIWSFLGVGIISDMFMNAIETITSKKKQIKLPDSDKKITVSVWNDTVANLTLMALGSSAPEIMLSVIELLGNKFYAGELGPSTIVGSAAFNLLVIIAVCVWVIPDGESRYVKEQTVFCITASFSMFAYFWLVIILQISSPNIVEIWEGLLTFIYFPLLIILAYLADIGLFSRGDKEQKEIVTGITVDPSSSSTSAEGSSAGRRASLSNMQGSRRFSQMSETDISRVQHIIHKERGHRMSVMEMLHLLDHRDMEAHIANHTLRAHHRMDACRALCAGAKHKDPGLLPPGGNPNPTASGQPGTLANGQKLTVGGHIGDESQVHIQFNSNTYEACNSRDESVVLVVERRNHEHLHTEISVQYRTTDEGSLRAEKHFEPASGVCFLPSGHQHASIHITLKKCDTPSIGDFHVELFDPRTRGTKEGGTAPVAVLGGHSTAKVELGEHKHSGPGMLKFAEEEYFVDGPEQPTEFEITVRRENGRDGEVKCKYRTERVTAVPGYDYTEQSDVLEFASGQEEAFITLTILPKKDYEKEDYFRVFLEESEGGVRFNPDDDGGEECCITTVRIKSRGDKAGVLRWFDALFNIDEVKLGTQHWGEQFVEAIYVNGSAEEQAEASIGDWMAHIIALPWKLLFAFCPPTTYWGGWFTFVVAIAFIGLVTTVIGDLASSFGCCADIPDSITAITFVALGTSLPDTFASKTAAIHDEYADNSIGNVTGSNSVNVFLGLGISWTIGAVYWTMEDPTDKWRSRYPDMAPKHPEGAFIVMSDDLGFSVTVFLLCCVICIGILFVRRRTLGCELGGSRPAKLVTSGLFIFLWFYYITLSSWKALNTDADSSAQVGAILCGLAVLVVLCIIAGFASKYLIGEPSENADEGKEGRMKEKDWQALAHRLKDYIVDQQIQIKQWKALFDKMQEDGKLPQYAIKEAEMIGTPVAPEALSIQNGASGSKAGEVAIPIPDEEGHHSEGEHEDTFQSECSDATEQPGSSSGALPKEKKTSPDGSPSKKSKSKAKSKAKSKMHGRSQSKMGDQLRVEDSLQPCKESPIAEEEDEDEWAANVSEDAKASGQASPRDASQLQGKDSGINDSKTSPPPGSPTRGAGDADPAQIETQIEPPPGG